MKSAAVQASTSYCATNSLLPLKRTKPVFILPIPSNAYSFWPTRRILLRYALPFESLLHQEASRSMFWSSSRFADGYIQNHLFFMRTPPS